MSLVAFLPCRAGSQRIVNKNTKPFLTYQYGLLQLKIQQLLNSTQIDSIFISTDEPNVNNILNLFDQNSRSKIFVHQRSQELCTSASTTDSLIFHASDILSRSFDDSTDILWTHTTCPFFTASIYDRAYQLYITNAPSHDSLIGVKEHRSFFWDSNNIPLNYSNNNIKWPFTQSVKPIYEVTSSIFIAKLSSYRIYGDRIGIRPYLFFQDNISSVDIDWPEDFDFAESIASSINLLN